MHKISIIHQFRNFPFNLDGVAVVKDARSDTCSRNILQNEELAEHIELSRIKDHFICKFHPFFGTSFSATLHFYFIVNSTFQKYLLY